MKLSILSPCLALVLLAAAHAQETAPAEPEDISVEMRCISLPQKLATPIIRKLRSEDLPAHAQAITELNTLLDQGAAKLHGWPMLTTHPGEKASYECVEELRYAKDIQPSSIEVSVQDNNGLITKVPTEVKGAEAAPVPTSFETRNIGVTLEITPYFQLNDQGVTVNFIAQHSRLKSMDRITLEQENATEKRSLKSTIEQPRFHTMKVASSVTMVNGDHRLVGTFPSPEGENMLELFILNAERLVKTASPVKKGGK